MRVLHLLALAAATVASPLLSHIDILSRAASQCVPVNYTFGVKVPYIDDPQKTASLSAGGLHFRLPKDASGGALISFFGNFRNNQTMSSQITTLSNSTSIANGTSSSSGSGSANGTTIVATTFSSGNSSTAVGSAQYNRTVTSTSSSGSSNSTATATADGTGVVTILTSANGTNSSNAQSLQNERAAAVATSCVANNDGASASAEEITTVTYQTGNGTQVNSVAYAACNAGVVVPASGADSGSSSSGSQASITGVNATVVCNGITSTARTSSTTYKMMVVGVYCRSTGFSGAFTGQRVAEAEASC